MDRKKWPYCHSTISRPIETRSLPENSPNNLVISWSTAELLRKLALSSLFQLSWRQMLASFHDTFTRNSAVNEQVGLLKPPPLSHLWTCCQSLLALLAVLRHPAAVWAVVQHKSQLVNKQAWGFSPACRQCVQFPLVLWRCCANWATRRVTCKTAPRFSKFFL